ncbi:MAG: hypothetical protein ACOYXY_21775 [Thermodesulfobacteriota bacterium]
MEIQSKLYIVVIIAGALVVGCLVVSDRVQAIQPASAGEPSAVTASIPNLQPMEAAVEAEPGVSWRQSASAGNSDRQSTAEQNSGENVPARAQADDNGDGEDDGEDEADKDGDNEGGFDRTWDRCLCG